MYTQAGTVAVFAPVLIDGAPMHSITCMPQYGYKSQEEVRYEDYMMGKKRNAQAGGGMVQPSVNPFGQPAAAANPFGQPAAAANPFGQPAAAANPFGQPAANPFGAPAAAPNPFGQPAAAANPFGQPAAAANPFAPKPAGASPFGAPAANPFGQPAAAAATPFGQPAANPFAPKPAGASPFGAPAANPFGQPAANPFGQPAAAANPFGQPSAANPFGQPAAGSPFAPKPAQGSPFAPANPFGQPQAAGSPFAINPFGQPQATPFGQPQQANPFGQPQAAGSPFAPQNPFGQQQQPMGSPFGQANPFGQQAASPFGKPASPFQQPQGMYGNAFAVPSYQPPQAPIPHRSLIPKSDAIAPSLFTARPTTVSTLDRSTSSISSSMNQSRIDFSTNVASSSYSRSSHLDPSPSKSSFKNAAPSKSILHVTPVKDRRRHRRSWVEVLADATNRGWVIEPAIKELQSIANNGRGVVSDLVLRKNIVDRGEIRKNVLTFRDAKIDGESQVFKFEDLFDFDSSDFHFCDGPGTSARTVFDHSEILVEHESSVFQQGDIDPEAIGSEFPFAGFGWAIRNCKIEDKRLKFGLVNVSRNE